MWFYSKIIRIHAAFKPRSYVLGVLGTYISLYEAYRSKVLTCRQIINKVFLLSAVFSGLFLILLLYGWMSWLVHTRKFSSLWTQLDSISFVCALATLVFVVKTKEETSRGIMCLWHWEARDKNVPSSNVASRVNITKYSFSFVKYVGNLVENGLRCKLS